MWALGETGSGPQSLMFILVMVVPVSLIGGLMAFLITYEEMQHHFVDRKRALAVSLRTAITAFVVLALLMAVAGELLFSHLA